MMKLNIFGLHNLKACYKSILYGLLFCDLGKMNCMRASLVIPKINHLKRSQILNNEEKRKQCSINKAKTVSNLLTLVCQEVVF